MQRSTSRRSKIAVSVFAGILVALIAAGVHIAMIPMDRRILLACFVGDFIAGLTTIIVSLAIQLKQEEIHYKSAIERAAIVSELNHHIRNAVFPMCLAIQKLGDAESMTMVNGAIDRINIALQGATADALSGRTQYSDEQGTNVER